jgi:hypothetical protein
MKLVELDDKYNIILNPELFLLKPFIALRDDRNDTELLLKEIGYLYFFYDLKSEFQFNTDVDGRHKDVLKQVDLPKTWKPDKLMLECIKVYEFLQQTVAGNLLESAYIAVNSLNAQLRSIDLNERDANNRPIWNMKQFGDTVKQVAEMIENIEKAEKAYIRGQENNEKLRGQKMKTLYEDGFVMRDED